MYEVEHLTADSPKTGEIMVKTNRLKMIKDAHTCEAGFEPETQQTADGVR